jgi:asparagine synthase (glutamine-hydrolysing)
VGLPASSTSNAASAIKMPELAERWPIVTHRGPDAGTWTDATAGIALGHRRLSIVDLSAAGASR